MQFSWALKNYSPQAVTGENQPSNVKLDLPQQLTWLNLRLHPFYSIHFRSGVICCAQSRLHSHNRRQRCSTHWLSRCGAIETGVKFNWLSFSSMALSNNHSVDWRSTNKLIWMVVISARRMMKGPFGRPECEKTDGAGKLYSWRWGRCTTLAPIFRPNSWAPMTPLCVFSEKWQPQYRSSGRQETVRNLNAMTEYGIGFPERIR